MAGRQRVLALLIQRYRLPRELIRQLLGTISEDLRRATRRNFALTPKRAPRVALERSHSTPTGDTCVPGQSDPGPGLEKTTGDHGRTSSPGYRDSA
ncbi:unnamed protein product [Boreogadus saida]